MVRSVRSRASRSFARHSPSLFGKGLLDQLHLQADAQQALAGFVVQLTADAAALHFLDVEHVLGQTADLLFALRQILHQAGLFAPPSGSARRRRPAVPARAAAIRKTLANPNCITPAVRPSAASGIDQQEVKRLVPACRPAERPAALRIAVQIARLRKLLDQPGAIRNRQQLRRFGSSPPAAPTALRILVQHVQPARVGAADVHQRFEESPQQLFQIARFELDAEQLVKGLCFGLADLIIGVVQRQDDAEMKLLADPLKIGVLVRDQRSASVGVSRRSYSCRASRIALGGRFSLARRRPLYSTCSMNLRAGRSLRQDPRRGAGRDGSKRGALLRFETQLPQAASGSGGRS